MSSMRTFFTSLGTVLFLVACSGAEDSNVFNNNNGGKDGGTSTGDSATTTDSGVNPNDPKCDPSKCNLTVPPNWSLTSYADGKGECAMGLDKKEVVSEAAVTGDACSCACNVTQQPDCSSGQIVRNLDYVNSPTCNTMATTLQVSNGCSQFNGALTTQAQHYSASLAASGGQCQYDAKGDDGKLTSKSARLCTPPANCQGLLCGANACITQAGDQTCPNGFPNKHVVGTAAKLECSSCSGGCKVEGVCGGTLSFYTDMGCTQGKRDFPVDGSCGTNAFVQTYYSYTFKGQLAKAGCAAGSPPTSTGTAKLDQMATVCCQK